MIVDAHHHVGPLHSSSLELSERFMTEDIGKRRGFLRRYGIDRCLLFPANTFVTADGIASYAAANSFVARYRDAAPEVVAGICGSVTPRDGAAACEEIRRCFEELDCAGIVFHHRWIGARLDDEGMIPLLETIASYRATAFVHIIADSKLESPWRLFRLAERFPELRFVGLDGFSSPDQSAYLRSEAGRHPNVSFDTGVMIAVAHGLREFIGTHGAHRVVFGTDYYSAPLFAHPFPLFELRAMDLSERELEQIFHDNLKSLISRG